MGTLLFTILHFIGVTEAPNEWYTVCTLISLDSISFSIFVSAIILVRLGKK
jgi:hypothetical protein